MDVAHLWGSSVHWIFQARILEWIVIPFTRGDLPNPRLKPTSFTSLALMGGFFTTNATWEVHINYISITKRKKKQVSWPSPLAFVGHGLGPLEMCPTHSEMP